MRRVMYRTMRGLMRGLMRGVMRSRCVWLPWTLILLRTCDRRACPVGPEDKEGKSVKCNLRGSARAANQAEGDDTRHHLAHRNCLPGPALGFGGRPCGWPGGRLGRGPGGRPDCWPGGRPDLRLSQWLDGREASGPGRRTRGRLRKSREILQDVRGDLTHLSSRSFCSRQRRGGLGRRFLPNASGLLLGGGPCSDGVGGRLLRDLSCLTISVQQNAVRQPDSGLNSNGASCAGPLSRPERKYILGADTRTRWRLPVVGGSFCEHDLTSVTAGGRALMGMWRGAMRPSELCCPLLSSGSRRRRCRRRCRVSVMIVMQYRQLFPLSRG